MSRPQHPSHPDRSSFNEHETPSLRSLPPLPEVEREAHPGGEERRSDGPGVRIKWGALDAAVRGGQTLAIVAYAVSVAGICYLAPQGFAAVREFTAELRSTTTQLAKTSESLATVAVEAHEARADSRAVRQVELPRLSADVEALRVSVEALRGEVRAAVVRR